MTLIPHDSLDWLVAMLREGMAYYRHAAEHVSDPEVARAFELAARTRGLILSDLSAMGAITEPESTAQTAAALATAPPQHRYDVLQQQFDAIHPEHQAQALVSRELASIRLIERCSFQSSMAILRVMKAPPPGRSDAGYAVSRIANRRVKSAAACSGLPTRAFLAGRSISGLTPRTVSCGSCVTLASYRPAGNILSKHLRFATAR